MLSANQHAGDERLESDEGTRAGGVAVETVLMISFHLLTHWVRNWFLKMPTQEGLQNFTGLVSSEPRDHSDPGPVTEWFHLDHLGSSSSVIRSDSPSFGSLLFSSQCSQVQAAPLTGSFLNQVHFYSYDDTDSAFIRVWLHLAPM